MTAILGAVLAGGRSSRFGSDKADALWRGRPLADHAAAALAPFVAEVVVVGRDGIADLPQPGLGPLGGIAGALACAGERGFASMLTIACDMPDVSPDLLAALVRRAPAYCIEAPVLGHWPVAALPALVADLAADGDRSVIRWARAIGALPVAAGEPIANVNTHEDLLAL